MNASSIEQLDLTLMFTDIVGYSRLMGQDQTLTITMLEDYRQILLEYIQKYHGKVVEFVGDAVFARFDTPGDAVAAAVGIQKALFTYNHFRDKGLPKLQTRIGLHSGKVAVKNNALFGDHVNIAARLEPLAYADGICVSEATYEAIKKENKLPVYALGGQSLKNIDSKVRVYLLRPEGITLKIRFHYWQQKFNKKLGAYRYPIAAVMISFLVAAWFIVPRLLVPGYDANYVEVVDFNNVVTQEAEWNYLGAGITDALRSQLADMREIYVVASGEGIQAPVILDGSVQRIGANVRIAYRLLRRDGMVQIAGGKLDGEYGDVFILQDRVVRAVARQLAKEFRLANYLPAQQRYTEDMTAYDYYLRGEDYLSRPRSIENLDEALKYFTTALVHDPAFAKAEAGLCESYWSKYLQDNNQTWIHKAKARCQNALALKTDLPEAIEVLGSVFVELGQLEDGLSLLEGLLAREPDNIPAMLALAEVSGRLGRVNEAVSILENAIAIQPKNWEVYHKLGYVYLLDGQLNNAVKEYKRVLDITPQNSGAYNNLGIAFLWLGELSKAADAFTSATEITPNPHSYNNTGTMYYYIGQYSRALQMFKEAIRLAPERPIYYVNLGNALRHMEGKSENAKINYEKAIALSRKQLASNDSDPAANWSMALSYMYLENLHQAEQYVSKLNDLLPNSNNALYAKLILEVYKKHDEMAMKTLDELLATGYSMTLIERDPDLTEFYQRHASILAD